MDQNPSDDSKNSVKNTENLKPTETAFCASCCKEIPTPVFCNDGCRIDYELYLNECEKNDGGNITN